MLRPNRGPCARTVPHTIVLKLLPSKNIASPTQSQWTEQHWYQVETRLRKGEHLKTRIAATDKANRTSKDRRTPNCGTKR